ncbi:MAG: hypothetical protein IT258_05100 [Saprospiraceae bacterium]|nr:hypothetical protein [Saprospiraceae bacterium]
MEGNLHNDNLERFFKENLERYKPAPSGDFWERMEGAIPPKPSFWKRHVSGNLKWLGLAVLLLSLAAIFALWRKDRQEIEQLSKQIAVAQEQLQLLSRQHSEMAESREAQPGVAENDVNEAGTTASALQSTTIATASPTAAFPSKAPQFPLAQLDLPNWTSGISQSSTQAAAPTSTISNQEKVQQSVVAAQNDNIASEQTAQNENPISSKNQDLTPAKLLESIALANAHVYSIQNQAPSVKHHGIKPNTKPYPRISLESGAAAFAMPLARLFQGDTLYAGSLKPSFSGNLSLHYELNPSFALHGGYAFKSVRSSRLSLLYNSVNFMVSKKWNWGRRVAVEGKAGLVLNKFYTYRFHSDGVAFRGRRDYWLGWQSSLNLSLPLSENLSLLVGPTIGTAISPVANGKQSWEAGLGMNLRYQF